MDDGTGFESIVRQLPQLFDSGCIDLRLASDIEAEPRLCLLGKRASWPFAEHDDLRENIGSGFVVRFWVAVVIEPLISGAHADHAIFVPEQLLPGKSWKDLRAARLGLIAEPNAQLLQGRDVLAVIVQRWRRKRRGDLAAPGEEPQFVAGNRRLHGCAVAPRWKQLVKRARVHHRTRKPVVSNLAAFFNHEDLERATCLPRELTEPNCPGKTGRTGTHKNDVHFESVAFRHRVLLVKRSGSRILNP